MSASLGILAVLFGLGALALGLITWRRTRGVKPLSEWFTVSFDESRVTLSAAPSGKEAWQQSFLWAEIIRVCFKAEGLTSSDGVYIFTSQRPESFVIPMEAQGGKQFWDKIIDLKLFPAELAIKAASASEGALLCWPIEKSAN